MSSSGYAHPNDDTIQFNGSAVFQIKYRTLITCARQTQVGTFVYQQKMSC